MNSTSRAALMMLAGFAVVAGTLAIQAVQVESQAWTQALVVLGLVLLAFGAYGMREELRSMVRGRRGEIVVYTIGVVGVMAAIGYLSMLFPARLDMTESKLYSLAPQTIAMLKRIEKPVHIVFFHDAMMRETIELYEQIARENKLIKVEFFDPIRNPAQARLSGVQFPGTAIMQSELRKVEINSGTESDIANGILRVSLESTQLVCFLDGHREGNPFSLESHDHTEGASAHTHGLGGDKTVTHEEHGMAKARQTLEALGYKVEKVQLAQQGNRLDKCSLLVVAGPKAPLLSREVDVIRAYLAKGNNAFLMLDPFIETGLEALLREYSVIADNDIVIDEASHFWADISSPAVSDYQPHRITADLGQTFFPGARSFSPTPTRVPGTTALPLINASKKSFGETNPARPEYEEGKDLPGPMSLMVIASKRVQSDQAAKVETSAQASADAKGLSGQDDSVKRSRLAIIGDSDFATNSFIHIFGNGKLFGNTVSYLAGKENLIGIQPRTYDPPRVNLTNRQMQGIFLISVVLVPALVAMIGLVVWWRRR